MTQVRNAHNILVVKSGGKRLLRRPGRKWSYIHTM